MTDDNTSNPWAYAGLLAGGILIVVGGLAGAFLLGTIGGMMGYGMMGNFAS